MMTIRFADMGTGWEKYARNHYPELFRVMNADQVRKTYAMNINDNGTIAVVAGDIVPVGPTPSAAANPQGRRVTTTQSGQHARAPTALLSPAH